MRVRVNSAECFGHGVCNATAPLVFALDDNGYSFVIAGDGDVPSELEEDAQMGALNCPERAIEILKGL